MGNSLKLPTKSVPGIIFRSALFGLPLFGVLITLLRQEGIHSSVEYGFSVLAALAVAGCLGHLTSHITRCSWELPLVYCLQAGLPPATKDATGDVPAESANWPLLVVLLFCPFLVLFAGLGNWV